MTNLHVRNVPDELHERIRNLAESGRRSLTAEVIVLLDRAVSISECERKRLDILDNMYRKRIRPPKGFPEAQDLIREDRDR